MQLPLHLHKYPFLRFLVPLIIGICLTHSIFHKAGCSRLAVILLLGIYISLLIANRYLRNYNYRWLAGIGIYLLLFILGIVITEYQLSNIEQQWSIKKTAYLGRIIDTPKEKEYSIFCNIQLIRQYDSIKTHCINKKIVLYLTKDSITKHPKRNDELLFYSRITLPHNNGNPEEFDYATYLSHQGISGTALAYSGQWQVIGHSSARSIQQIALDYRSKLLEKIKKLGFTGDEYTVLSALVLGYQDELSQEIRESYSISGVSHVLSLSGLHIGFIYLLLDSLLRFANRNRKMLIAKQFFIILFLWIFALLTGLLSPVIRSVIMFSLMAISQLRIDKPTTLNTLAIAAFFMLIYNPFYLYDISFQLSFTAVAGIVILQPLLYRQIKTKNKILNYLWGLISVSIAAQAITAPIVTYYFSRFSTHFLLSNILVIPLVSVIMYLAVITLSIGFVPYIQEFLANILQHSIQLLNNIVSLVEHLPYSTINQINITKIEVLLLYIIIFSGVLYLHKHRKYLHLFIFCTFLFILLQTKENYQAQQIHSIHFYNVRNCPTVHFIESQQRSYLFSTERDSVIQKLQYATKRYWDKLRLKTPTIVPFNYSKSNIWRHNNILSFQGKIICIVNDNRWKNKCATKPLKLDYLYLCKGYHGKLLWLMPLFNIQQVVIDSSISEHKKERFKRECTLLGLPFISLSEKGAYQIYL